MAGSHQRNWEVGRGFAGGFFVHWIACRPFVVEGSLKPGVVWLAVMKDGLSSWITEALHL